jgi:ATP phosphoribosyltransferase regulatory subunit
MLVQGQKKVPPGMRDWLPGEAFQKRDLINRFLTHFSLWGYQEINTPLLEYYQTFSDAGKGSELEQIYKLIDRDGQILALRPEMTLPITRVVSSKLSEKYPQRLMYGGEVFRYEEIQTGRQREFTQVGVELLGASGPAADSEVLALAIEALTAIGLTDFTISLGHTGVLKGLLASLNWEETALYVVRKLILEKDFVGLKNYLLAQGMTSAETVVSLLTEKLIFPQVLNKNLPAGVLEALEELKQIRDYLKDYGTAHYLQLDLSTLREQIYYTGMVFEIYTSGIGYPIGGGGRYDRLFDLWGLDCPATGFALGVERVLLSLPEIKKSKPEKPYLLVGENAKVIISRARKLRQQGKKVITQIGSFTHEEAEELAKQSEAILVNDEGENSNEI